MKAQENWVGAWAYTIGVILSVVIGIGVGLSLSNHSFSKFHIYASALLVILGFVIGSLNVSSKDSNMFLIAGAILVIVSKFGLDVVTAQLSTELQTIENIGASIFNSLLLLFIPATIIVALKALFSLSRV